MPPGSVIPLKSLHWRLLFWACAAAVLALSLMPPSQPLPTTGWDKSNHLLAFGVLALLGRHAFAGNRAGHWLVLLLALAAYGGVIELLQGMTAYREADWFDLVADTLGVLVGMAVDWLVRARPGRLAR